MLVLPGGLLLPDDSIVGLVITIQSSSDTGSSLGLLEAEEEQQSPLPLSSSSIIITFFVLFSPVLLSVSVKQFYYRVIMAYNGNLFHITWMCILL